MKTYLIILLVSYWLASEKIPIIIMSVGKENKLGTEEEETCFGCGDCSIYCVIEGEYSLSSSSHLEAQANNNYEIIQLDDYNLQTAWIEGRNDYGINEWFEYKFDKTDYSDTPISLDGLYLFNGYRKSLLHWNGNSRVKSLKMITDNRDYAILQLADTQKIQFAKFPEIKLKKNTTIRFEILEVYPGDKYQDVALSELKFEGVHHH